MKAWNGIITDYVDIYTIKTEGKPAVWMETGTDRDGEKYETAISGYEYNGKRYVIGTDRDGWPIAWEN